MSSFICYLYTTHSIDPSLEKQNLGPLGTFGNLGHVENAMTFKATIVVLLRKLLEQMEKQKFVLPKKQDFRLHESFMFVFWVL